MSCICVRELTCILAIYAFISTSCFKQVDTNDCVYTCNCNVLFSLNSLCRSYNRSHPNPQHSQLGAPPPPIMQHVPRAQAVNVVSIRAHVFATGGGGGGGSWAKGVWWGLLSMIYYLVNTYMIINLYGCSLSLYMWFVVVDCSLALVYLFSLSFSLSPSLF